MKLLLRFTILLVPSVICNTRLKRGGYGRPQLPQSNYSPPQPSYAQPFESNYASSHYETPQSGYSQPEYIPDFGYSNGYGNGYGHGGYNNWFFRQRGPQIPWWKRQQAMGGGYYDNYQQPQYNNQPQYPQGEYQQPQYRQPEYNQPNYPGGGPQPPNENTRPAPNMPVTTVETAAPTEEIRPPAPPILTEPATKAVEYPDAPPMPTGHPMGLPGVNPEYQEAPTTPIPPPVPSVPEYPAPGPTQGIPPPPPPDPKPVYPEVPTYPPVTFPNGFTLPPQAQVPDIPPPPGK